MEEDSYPWCVLIAGDERHPLHERQRVIIGARGKQQCCTGGVAKELVAGASVAVMFGCRAQAKLQTYTWAASSAMSVADMERKHRAAASIVVQQDVEWWRFCASAVLKDQSTISKRTAAEAIGLGKMLGIANEPAQADDIASAKRPKAKSAFETFVDERVAEQKGGGGNAGGMCFSGEGKRKLFQEFHAL